MSTTVEAATLEKPKSSFQQQNSRPLDPLLQRENDSGLSKPVLRHAYRNSSFNFTIKISARGSVLVSSGIIYPK